jgi:hypothetical protein
MATSSEQPKARKEEEELEVLTNHAGFVADAKQHHAGARQEDTEAGARQEDSSLAATQPSMTLLR